VAEKRREEQSEMPFLDHLEELRWRIIWIMVAVVVAFMVGFTVVSNYDIIGILEFPAKEFLHGQKLIYTHPADPFTILMNVSFGVSFVLASPVIFYQVWAFLSPAMHAHEKRLVVPLLIGAVGLFLVGCTLSVLWVLPITLELLGSISAASLTPMISAVEYFSFAVMLTLAFGVVFELPILIVILTAIGLVTPRFLSTYRRHAFVILLIVCAVITPGDMVISTLMLFIPLYGLYEVSIILSWLVFRAKQKKVRREAEAERIAPASRP
jgi:sec-independent protein translocase protein TatC